MRSYVPAIYDCTLAVPKDQPQPRMLRLLRGQSSVVRQKWTRKNEELPKLMVASLNYPPFFFPNHVDFICSLVANKCWITSIDLVISCVKGLFMQVQVPFLFLTLIGQGRHNNYSIHIYFMDVHTISVAMLYMVIYRRPNTRGFLWHVVLFHKYIQSALLSTKNHTTYCSLSKEKPIGNLKLEFNTNVIRHNNFHPFSYYSPSTLEIEKDLFSLVNAYGRLILSRY